MKTCPRLFFLVFVSAVYAQAPPGPAFDVTSIRLHPNTDDRWSYSDLPGRFVAVNLPLRRLIVHAYDIDITLQQYLLVGGSDELLDTHFDVTATRPEGTTSTQYRPMLARLLEERFGLRTHVETRELPVYVLVSDRGGELGPDIRPSEVDCQTFLRERGEGRIAQEPKDWNGRSWCFGRYDFGRGDGLGLRYAGDIADLVSSIQPFADRPIVDRTGLTGTYEWTLLFLPPSTRSPGAAADSNVPSLYTAVTEQLGLKLQPRRESQDVRVIDTASMPSPN